MIGEPGDMNALRQHFGSGAWAARSVLGYTLGDGLGCTASGETWAEAWERLDLERGRRSTLRARQAWEFERAHRRGRWIMAGVVALMAGAAGTVLWCALR